MSGCGRAATVNDIFTSIHSQLLLVIEWAKTLPPFAALSTDDQVYGRGKVGSRTELIP